MTLDHYLLHRPRYEIAIAAVIVLLFGITNATSVIIENTRTGLPADAIAAFAKEMSSSISVAILLPLLVWFLRKLNLNLENIRWRLLWHLPGFVIFTLLHVGLFTLMRELMWAAVGDSFESGSLALGLLYEGRKDLLTYLCLVLLLHGYWFILHRLQGEAGFLQTESGDSQIQDQFLVKMLNREYLVKAEKIDWVQSASNYVLLHCAERSYPMRLPISRLAEQLDPQQFKRVHRTAIVNIRRIESLPNSGDMQLQLQGGALVPVSKTYMAELKQALGSNPVSV